MEIIRCARRIYERGVRADLVGADGKASRVRYDTADAVDEVVVKGRVRDRCLIPGQGVTIGIVEDIITDRDAGVVAPKTDLTRFAICTPESESVVSDQPVAGSIRH